MAKLKINLNNSATVCDILSGHITVRQVSTSDSVIFDKLKKFAIREGIKNMFDAELTREQTNQVNKILIDG